MSARRGGVPDGDELAVIHVVDGRQRLEYPIGRVLYEPSGWMSSISVSPSGDRIAFAEHPVAGDNRGDISIVDASGKKTTLAAGWEDLGQTAWSPDGREIWFSGSTKGIDHSMFAVTLGRQNAPLLTGAGSLNLQDVSTDGRVIVSNGGRRMSMIVKAPGATEEKDLAWMDYSWPADISEDGRQLLFSEQGVAGGPGYAAYLRGDRRVAGRAPRQGRRAFVVPRRTMGNRNGSFHAHADAAADGNGPASRDPEPRHHRVFVGGLLPRRQADRVRRH